MKRKIFWNFVGMAVIVMMIFLGIGVLWAQNSGFLLSGKISQPDNWQGWNVDNVWFATGGSFQPKDPNFEDNHQVYYEQSGVLRWKFWIGTAGWATFDHNVWNERAKIQCAAGILKEKVVGSQNSLCPVSGFAWSESAGWISLKGVNFNPNSANLEGFGWSEALGWVPMFTGKVFDFCKENPTDPSCVECIPGDVECLLNKDREKLLKDPNADGVPVNFIGKVAILGNIAGTKIFEIANKHDFENQNVGHNYMTIQHALILNTIRWNVAQITRNIEINDALATSVPHSKFLYGQGKDYCFGNSCPGENYTINKDTLLRDDVETIIVKGGNVIIDMDINNTDHNKNSANPEKMKGIIVLRDENGKGGDVYITKNVNQIYAYVFAEGSVFSGEKNTDGTYRKYIVPENPMDIGLPTAGLPMKQLYINGVVISKNTIGGNATGDIVSRCPILVKNCDENNAVEYDWSYFRLYSPAARGATPALPESRKNISDLRVKNATVIIDYNSNILTKPPIGFEKFQ